MEKILPKIQNLQTESQIKARSGRWGRDNAYGFPDSDLAMAASTRTTTTGQIPNGKNGVANSRAAARGNINLCSVSNRGG
ncbi:MAG: hypothetical protein COB39_09255 [Marinosulfonomonas sp.]|nr:MAG: hypothetical protein COB39_09255 [Marinosulfonomonas sp.]